MEPNEDGNVFEQASSELTNSFVEKFVGEGKKFKDIEALAKAYENADKHIPKLNDDLQAMRDFMAVQFEAISKRNEQAPPKELSERVEERLPVPAPPSEDKGDDLDTRILKALAARDETKVLQTNADFAQEVMIERFGSKEAAVEAVRAKAAELGVNPQFIADTAFRSPKALFSMMGIDPTSKPRSSASPAPSSDIDTARLADMTSVKPNTFAYYEQIRKSSPGKQLDVKTNMQMMEDAQRLGADFFKR